MDFAKLCEQGNVAQVQERLAATGETKPSREDLETGIRYACIGKRPEVVALLLGCGPAAFDKVDDTALCLVATDLQIAKAYVENGFDPNVGIGDLGPLLGICSDIECTKLLLAHGADPNVVRRARTFHGKCDYTPLQVAICHGIDFAELLVSHGAKLLPDHLFGLMATSGYEENMRWMLRHGLDVNALHPRWGTALHYAVGYSRWSYFVLLLEEGADPALRPQCANFPNMTPREVLEDISSRARERVPAEAWDEWRRLLSEAEARVAKGLEEHGQDMQS